MPYDFNDIGFLDSIEKNSKDFEFLHIRYVALVTKRDRSTSEQAELDLIRPYYHKLL